MDNIKVTKSITSGRTGILCTLFLFFALSSAATPNLNSVCLDSNGTQFLEWADTADTANSTDTLGYDLSKMTLSGNCDSVQILYPVTVLNYTTYVPIGSMVKLDSCRLNVIYLIMDTIINVCEAAGIEYNNVDNTVKTNSTFKVVKLNGRTTLSWNNTSASIVSVKLFDLNGRRIMSRNIQSGQPGIVLDGIRSSPYIVVANFANGKKIQQLIQF